LAESDRNTKFRARPGVCTPVHPRNPAGPVRGLAMLLQLAEFLATESCDSPARPLQLRVQNISGAEASAL
jgi:hypothetical protein